MGDRANIMLVFEGPNHSYQPIYIYSHWDGRQGLNKKLAKILDSKEARSRWNDEAYLARIIFDGITEGEDKETGYGLAPYVCDQDHPHILVNLSANCVDGLPYEKFISIFGRKK